jgi:hypothetical protein
MATAFKAFPENWIELPSPEGYWRRQASTGGLNPSLDDEALVLKRPAFAKQSGAAGADDPGSWTRMLLRQRPLMPANRDDPHHESIETQVEELRRHATEEEEAFSEDSAAAALRFCHDLAADREPAIFLMANGNLRAVWQNEARDQIGIQFMANGLLQYVILRDRDGMTLKALGEDVSFDRVRDTVDVQELTGLWFCGEG